MATVQDTKKNDRWLPFVFGMIVLLALAGMVSGVQSCLHDRYIEGRRDEKAGCYDELRKRRLECDERFQACVQATSGAPSDSPSPAND
jgi:hypothetical protein